MFGRLGSVGGNLSSYVAPAQYTCTKTGCTGTSKAIMGAFAQYQRLVNQACALMGVSKAAVTADGVITKPTADATVTIARAYPKDFADHPVPPGGFTYQYIAQYADDLSEVLGRLVARLQPRGAAVMPEVVEPAPGIEPAPEIETMMPTTEQPSLMPPTLPEPSTLPPTVMQPSASKWNIQSTGMKIALALSGVTIIGALVGAVIISRRRSRRVESAASLIP